MPSFSVTPAGPFPPTDPGEFPNYIRWQINGVDVEGWQTIDTVNFIRGVSVTSGGGGGIDVNIEGGCLPLFLDNFTGTAGVLLSAHTPDMAPSGFAWSQFGVNSAELDGAGKVIVTPPASFGASYRHIFASPVATGPAFRMKLVCRMPGA